MTKIASFFVEKTLGCYQILVWLAFILNLKINFKLKCFPFTKIFLKFLAKKFGHCEIVSYICAVDCVLVLVFMIY